MAKCLKRCEILANYLLENNTTIRKCASFFGYSKSLVHLEVSKKLKQVNHKLYLKVKILLDKNFKEKNIRGGMATKQKFLKLKNKKND